MKLFPLLLSSILLAATAGAHPVKWSATGTVASAHASFAGVTPGAAVQLEFSFDSEASLNGMGPVPLGTTTRYQAEFYGAIDLKLSVTIGAQKWESTVAQTAMGTPYTLFTQAYDGTDPVPSLAPDRFAVAASSSDGASFPSFPYQGSSTGNRNMTVTFEDTTSLCDFLVGHQIPGESVSTLR